MTIELETSPLHFEKFGRTYQLRIRTAEDLRQVPALDDALWIATSAPISSLNCDSEFLDFVDTDDNQRIRCNEIREAIVWLLDRLGDTGRVADGSDRVPLEALNPQLPEACELRDTARYILGFLDRGDADSVEFGDVEEFSHSLDTQPINGDGVVPPSAAAEEDLRQFITDVLSCTEGARDRTGRAGITREDLDRFLASASAYLEWLSRADPGSEEWGHIMPLGEDTPAAFRALHAVRDKVEDFFARCRLADFVGLARFMPSLPETEDPAEEADRTLRAAPLAEPTPGRLLPLEGKVNPAYREELEQFRNKVVEPVLGEKEALSPADWARIKEFFSGHAEWLDSRRGGGVAELQREKLRRYGEGDFAERVRALLEEDQRVAEWLSAARDLRKLLLYHRYLLPLVNNFVSFPDLYDPERRAMFEMGSLVIDGRWFNFAVRVEDRGEHARVARTSRIYVMYVELTRPDRPEPLLVAVPATSGTAGNLCAGKRGVFYDTDGRHYDARVVEIIENPISFKEALLSPFVRLGRFIVGKIEAMSTSAEKTLVSRVAEIPSEIGETTAEPRETSPEPARSSSASRRDILVGASFSIAALSSAFAFITKTLAGLAAWQILTAVLLAAAAVLVPTAVIAGIKLRRRDLSAILEGCGWAINARMRLNRRQRKQFTRGQPYPAGATGTPRRRWLLVVLLLVLVAFGVAAAMKAFAGWRASGAGPRSEEAAAERLAEPRRTSPE